MTYKEQRRENYQLLNRQIDLLEKEIAYLPDSEIKLQLVHRIETIKNISRLYTEVLRCADNLVLYNINESNYPDFKRYLSSAINKICK